MKKQIIPFLYRQKRNPKTSQRLGKALLAKAPKDSVPAGLPTVGPALYFYRKAGLVLGNNSLLLKLWPPVLPNAGQNPWTKAKKIGKGKICYINLKVLRTINNGYSRSMVLAIPLNIFLLEYE